ncbi:unnamed protein product [Choristocarpus tenellus]
MYFGDPEGKERARTSDLPRSWNRASGKMTQGGLDEGNVNDKDGDDQHGSGSFKSPDGDKKGSWYNHDKERVEPEEGISGLSIGGGEGDMWVGQREDEDESAFMERTCIQCQGGENFKETQLHCSGIWLHALQYEGDGWTFTTRPPPWSVL